MDNLLDETVQESINHSSSFKKYLESRSLKKVVLKLNTLKDKRGTKALKIVSELPGVEAASVVKEETYYKLMVIGKVDPLEIVSKVWKVCESETLSVEPGKEPEKKKEERRKDEEREKTEEKRKMLREMSEEVWNAQEISAIVDELSVLPESPNCPFLLQLSFEGSYDLTVIPSSFFQRMPVLNHLNLSRTSIKSLPASLYMLVALKTLILRNCELFMKLPPQIGDLHNIEVLDLDETQIFSLPKEIRKLSKLKFLRVSLFGNMNCEKRMHQDALIHPGTISALSQLTQLSIDVDPDDKRWNAAVEFVMEEACSLGTLDSLILFLPNFESLGKGKRGSTSLSYYSWPRFRFTVGQHKQDIFSRVPKEVEAHFQEWDKCLKFVKGEDIPSEMKKVLECTKAFYLDRHATARSLCDFGIKNMQELEFCLLLECNNIQTIISDFESCKEQIITLVDDRKSFESGEGSHSAPEASLLNLQYLHIYYLKKLVSIWRTSTYNWQCLSGLKFLAIHTCPKLSIIFTPALLANLVKLEVLIVKDCTEVTSMVSLRSNESVDPQVLYLPSLKRISLLYLPKLASISSGFLIAPKLQKIGFYSCPKLESLSIREMSSEDLEVIRGESNWWEALTWNKSEWRDRNRIDYLQSIFSPITSGKDVMRQLEER